MSKASRATAPESEVDRLIRLASDEKQPATGMALELPAPVEAASPLEAKEIEIKSADRPGMWKALQQLKAILPYVSRLLPLLDARFLPLLELLGAGHGHSAEVPKELRERIESIHAAQQELRTASQNQAADLNNQAVDLKKLENQIEQLWAASRQSERGQTELAESLRSTRRLIGLIGAGLGILAIILIVLVSVFLTHSHR
jgi:DNA repair exonuclease SbcCD ATPase subunit